ncbi:MAG: hypothetical protein IH906_01205 [Proteobacteria bacterium]|nr:hypothetical protein [Pseudomonadota bacterium]
MTTIAISMTVNPACARGRCNKRRVPTGIDYLWRRSLATEAAIYLVRGPLKAQEPPGEPGGSTINDYALVVSGV